MLSQILAFPQPNMICDFGVCTSIPVRREDPPLQEQGTYAIPTLLHPNAKGIDQQSAEQACVWIRTTSAPSWSVPNVRPILRSEQCPIISQRRKTTPEANAHSRGEKYLILLLNSYGIPSR
jgi:hypothetical protein